jgi:hypothetical protein
MVAHVLSDDGELPATTDVAAVQRLLDGWI